MMQKLKKLFVSRKAILVIFLVLTAVILVSVIIPQQHDGQPGTAWYQAYSFLDRVVTAAGLDHVYGTWWFLIVAAFFLLSLSISTFDQGRFAWKRMMGDVSLPHAEEVVLAGSREQVEQQLLYSGYWSLSATPVRTRLVKNPWGFWGNYILHIGLALTVLFAVIYKATEHRFITRVIAGEEIYFSDENRAERKGVLAGSLAVPEAIRVDSVVPVFYDNGQLLALSSSGTFRSEDGELVPFHVAINDKISYEGMLVYQMNSFGKAFQLSLRSAGNPIGTEVLYLPAPSRKGALAYGSLDLPGGYILKAKYGEPTGQHNSTGDPHLTLRLLHGKDIVGDVYLENGVTGSLGSFMVTVEKSGWWTEYLFEGSRGITGIFAGFACILLGVVITYGAIPYVVIITGSSTGDTLSWESPRSNMFFCAERDRVLAIACREDI